MSALPPARERLDSWKAIAEYLKRDLATVRRWEKGLGLPVHRVGGAGRSVFAYTSEIDSWLAAAGPPSTAVVATSSAAVSPAGGRTAHSPWLLLVLLVGVLLTSLYARPRPSVPGELKIEVTATGLIARGADREEQWRHEFPKGSTSYLPPSAPVQITRGAAPAVYVATSYSARQIEEQVESGVLSRFDLAGRLQQSFSFRDRVTFGGVAYGAPWAITAFAVTEADAGDRVAVAAHHYSWNPGLVTVLDDQWRQVGTFAHAGWIEQVRWLNADRLLIGGFSNAYDGGMVALLDPAALDGQGPAPAGSPHVCESCGAAGPLRMFIFPRSELNRVSASPFNRVLLYTSDGLISARTIEMPVTSGDADAVYEFNQSLDLVSARFSERYWDLHRALEADGRITHRRDQCPDRDGPREVRIWEAATGWRTLATR